MKINEFVCTLCVKKITSGAFENIYGNWKIDSAVLEYTLFLHNLKYNIGFQKPLYIDLRRLGIRLGIRRHRPSVRH